MTLEELLARAGELMASDVHLLARTPVVFRIAGELSPTGEAVTSQEIAGLFEGRLTSEQVRRLNEKRHLCFLFVVQGLGNFRVTLFYEKGEMGAAIRVIPFTLPSRETLGLPEEIEEWGRRPSGLILVTGATGAGKTTTLNTLIDIINRTSRGKIVTVEDPIEFVHRNERCLVAQKEVGADTLSFAEAIVQILREDPDVIVIGELRDRETISTALTAAETGHLVLGTLHTRTACSTVERILDVFTADQQPQIRAQLSTSLVSVISQLLLPRADRRGLVLAYETLVATPAVRTKIREGNMKNLPDEITTGGKHHMRTMDDSIRMLYEAAVITYDVAASYVSDPLLLMRR